MNKAPKLLAVIDYQNDFVTGSLGFEGAAAIDDGIARLAQTYLAQGDHVLFTYDTHDDTYLETREGRALPIPHCNPNETGWRLYGKTQELCCETCANHQIHTVCKHTFGMPPSELVKLGKELPGLRDHGGRRGDQHVRAVQRRAAAGPVAGGTDHSGCRALPQL